MDKWEIVYKPTRELIEQAIELDKLVFDCEEDIVDINTCMEWADKNDKLYTFLLYNNMLVGYTNLMPVTDNCYNRFKQGRLKDSKITANDIVEFSTIKPNKCIFISIVIHPDFQTGLALRRLFKGLCQKLERFKQDGIEISSMLADCVTDMGEKSAIKYFNAKQVGNSTNGKIYEGSIEISK